MTYRIMIGNSMKPEFPFFSITKIIKVDEYKEGDVVAFKAKNGLKYCHRIIEINNDTFTTKGDNKESSKQCEINVPIKNIEGKIVRC